MKKRFGALSSSVNPEQLSARVSGAILMFSSVIILIGGWLGVPLADGQIAQFAQQAGMAIGFLWFMFGAIRRFVILVQQRWSEYRAGKVE